MGMQFTASQLNLHHCHCQFTHEVARLLTQAPSIYTSR